MITLDESTNEFIARNVADLGKAILTVGFASYFYEKMSLYLRISIPLVGLFCLVSSVIIHFRRKGAKQ